MIIMFTIISKKNFSISVFIYNKIIYFKNLEKNNNEKKYINLIIEEAKYITKAKKRSLKLLVVCSLSKQYICTVSQISVCNSFKILLRIPVVFIPFSEILYSFLNKQKFSEFFLYKKKVNINSRLLCYFIFYTKTIN